ncbi:MAG: hypothetical protein JXA21_28510 [Anaerolineae bacterium]|nr:hypothetical protein [Anaerolineae bacterium]
MKKSMSSEKLPQPQPTLEEWRRLYAAAQAFKEAAPWESMTEEQLFGVRDPETGQVGYCSITGLLGEHFALIVYEGEKGLGCYFDLLRRHHEAFSDLEEREASLSILETPQCQVSFEDRELLRNEDREVIKSLGLRFRGRNAWSQFRSYQPGRVPWFINAPQARFLTIALEQTLIAIREMDAVEVFAHGEVGAPETVKMLVRSEENGQWLSRWEEVTPLYPTYTANVDESLFIAARRELPQRKMCMQMHLALITNGIAEEYPPFFPYLLLFVDEESGMILGQDLFMIQSTLEESMADLPNLFLDRLRAMRMRPQEVQVATKRIYQLLALAAGHLGIKLSLVGEMPALEETLDALEDWLMGM